MSIKLKLSLILLLLLQIILIIKIVRRKKLTIKYACFWLILIIMMGIVIAFPEIVYKLSELSGFEIAANMVFLMGFFFLFFTVFILTTSISVQNEKIKALIQEISILKESVENDEKRK